MITNSTPVLILTLLCTLLNFSLSAQSVDTLGIFHIEEYTAYKIKWVQEQVETQDVKDPRKSSLKNITSTFVLFDVYRAGLLKSRVMVKDASVCIFEFHDKFYNESAQLIKATFIVMDVCTRTISRENAHFTGIKKEEVDSVFIYPLDSTYQWQYTTYSINDFKDVKPLKLDSLRQVQMISFLSLAQPSIKDKKEYAPITGRYLVEFYTKTGRKSYVIYQNNAIINGWRYETNLAWNRNFAQEVWDAMDRVETGK